MRCTYVRACESARVSASASGRTIYRQQRARERGLGRRRSTAGARGLEGGKWGVTYSLDDALVAQGHAQVELHAHQVPTHVLQMRTTGSVAASGTVHHRWLVVLLHDAHAGTSTSLHSPPTSTSTSTMFAPGGCRQSALSSPSPSLLVREGLLRLRLRTATVPCPVGVRKAPAGGGRRELLHGVPGPAPTGVAGDNTVAYTGLWYAAVLATCVPNCCAVEGEAGAKGRTMWSGAILLSRSRSDGC